MKTNTSLFVALGVLLSVSGCKNFVECQQDLDCAQFATTDGQPLFCSDNMCVVGSPRSKLCQEVFPNNSPASATPIGTLVNTSTGNDLVRLQSVKLAVEEMNVGLVASGKPPLALHVCETSATPADMLKSYQVLVHDRNAVAVVGPSGSGNVTLLSAEVLEQKVPIMSWSASAKSIGDLPGQGLFFRTVPSDILQGRVLAGLIPPGSETSTGMIVVDDPYGQGMLSSVLGSKAGLVAKPSLTYKESVGTDQAAAETTLTTAVGTLRGGVAPKALVAVTNLFSDKFLAQMDGYGTVSPAMPILMGDAAKNSKVLDLLNKGIPSMGTNLQRVKGTAPAVDSGSAAYTTFVAKFNQRWQGATDPTTTVYSFYAYDAAYAVGAAVCAAGTVTPARVSEYLLRMNNSQCPPQERLKIGQDNFLNSCNRLSSQSSLAIQGTTGVVSFTPHGDRETGLYEVWSIDVNNKKFLSTPAP
jgi:branched-chain amino acid transport system substrate-binding protein